MIATELHPVLAGSAYQAYVYAYPHKTAYRSFAARPLREVWADEPRTGLFLYVHVPFCTMRCGFCNLFTTPNPKDDLVTFYLDALRVQAEVVRDAIPAARFARFAIGGGTPTYLDESQMGEVFDIAERMTGESLSAIPVGVETSPDTLTPAKVELLKARGVSRVSIGVQSFIESEAANSGRPQSRRDVDAALSLLTGANLPTVNIDLIYGLPGQTVETWLYSLREALRYSPEELYLYPLYVRPLTGLGRSHKEWDDVRLACYREARDVLLAEGYEQVSMRMFQRADCSPHAPRDGFAQRTDCVPETIAPLRGGITRSVMSTISADHSANLPHYCCQDDGMIGLGCGARSYTRGLHYSLDYAVGPRSVKGIIADYLSRTREELACAEHGFALDADEQRRRYLLQSILNVEGLESSRYIARFGTDPADDFPELHGLAEAGLLACETGKWTPTPLGLERSDSLGPWFFSARVRALMAEYHPK
jgi:oxygen-independent coproporphyrinogen III oxidase